MYSTVVYSKGFFSSTLPLTLHDFVRPNTVTY